MISDHISSTNVKTRDMEIISFKPDNEDVNNNSEPHASNSNGQEKEIHVIVDQRHLRNSSSESTDKMPIIANELTLAESMQNRTQKAQVFFMSSGGSIKRKLLSDDVSAKKRHIPDTLMPGTTIQYSTRGQSSRNKNGRIKRPMNAFMIWARDTRGKISQCTPDASNSTISIKLGELWNKLPKEEKQKYYMEAERVKARHRREFPDWNYQPLRIPPPKKNEERDMNHKQMWNRYTENRSKQPPPTGPVRIAQPPPTGPVRIAQPPPTGPVRIAQPPPTGSVRIAQTPQGQFIHCLGQKAYSNIPMIPRTATPLPPVQTMIPPSNQLSSTSCLRIVRPVQQQLHPVNQQLRPTQQQPCHRQTFLPQNLLNGSFKDLTRLQGKTGIPNFNAVQDLTIFHKPLYVSVQKGRPPTVTRRLDVVPPTIDNCNQLSGENSTNVDVKKKKKVNKKRKTRTKTDEESEHTKHKTKKKQEKKQYDKSSKKSKTETSNTSKDTVDNDSEHSSSTSTSGSSTQIREKHPEDTGDHDSKTFSTTTTGSTTQVLEKHPEDTVDTDSKHSSCITTTGSTTQIREEHPEDFWPFSFPPAGQASPMASDDVFVGKLFNRGPIEDTLEDTDSGNTFLCEQKEKPGGEKFNVNVSIWQDYLRNSQQHKSTEHTEKLDTYFIEEKTEIVNCPSDLDICPAPVALTLTRRYDNKEDEKLNTSFGNSITNALSVLGGNQEGYTKSSNDIPSCENDMVSKIEADVTSQSSMTASNLPNIHYNAITSYSKMNSNSQLHTNPAVSYTQETDTLPIKKRTYRYLQSIDDHPNLRFYVGGQYHDDKQAPGSRDYQVNGQKPTMLHTRKGHVQNDNCTPGLQTTMDTMQGFR